MTSATFTEPVSTVSTMNEAVEDDPYFKYMLRHPAERASTVVPQLPKQPEMADTRLRYRRIPPTTRSGSMGSFGGHFPPRFKFPPRPSLLESLSSDDEHSSFSMRRKRGAGRNRRRRRCLGHRNRRITVSALAAGHAFLKPPVHPTCSSSTSSAHANAVNVNHNYNNHHMHSDRACRRSTRSTSRASSLSSTSSSSSTSSGSSHRLSTSPTTPVPSNPLLPSFLVSDCDSTPANSCLEPRLTTTIATATTLASAVPVAKQSGPPSRATQATRRRDVTHIVHHEPVSYDLSPDEPAAHPEQPDALDGTLPRPSPSGSHSPRRSHSLLRRSLRELRELRDSGRRRHCMAVTDGNESFDCEHVNGVLTHSFKPQPFEHTTLDSTQFDLGSEQRETELSLSFARRHLYVDDSGNPLSVLQRLWRALKSARSPFSRFARRGLWTKFNKHWKH